MATGTQGARAMNHDGMCTHGSYDSRTVAKAALFWQSVLGLSVSIVVIFVPAEGRHRGPVNQLPNVNVVIRSLSFACVATICPFTVVMCARFLSI